MEWEFEISGGFDRQSIAVLKALEVELSCSYGHVGQDAHADSLDITRLNEKSQRVDCRMCTGGNKEILLISLSRQ
jgi:hypothetical protein